jgi:hypothetical protein
MSDELDSSLFDEKFEEDLEDGFEDFDFDEEDLDDLDDLLADGEEEDAEEAL